MGRTAQQKLDKYYNNPDHINDLRRLTLRKSRLTHEQRIELYREELVYLHKRQTVVLRKIRKLEGG